MKRDPNSIVSGKRYPRIQNKVFLENARLNEATGCIEWTASRNPQGYGRALIVVGEPADLRAHRRAWIMEHGPIPDGLLVLHKCDNPPCVNPAHLFLGTDADNTRDKYRKRRNINLAGAEHARSKLTPEDVLRIREAALFGATPHSLSKVWPVADKTLRQIIQRDSWKHLGAAHGHY